MENVTMIFKEKQKEQVVKAVENEFPKMDYELIGTSTWLMGEEPYFEIIIQCGRKYKNFIKGFLYGMSSILETGK